MRIAKKIGLITLTFMVLSCAKLPHPHISESRVMRNGTQIIESTADFSQLRWWKKMRDPVLNRLIRKALLTNNQIQTAQANMMQAQAQLKAARFAWLPTLNASGNGLIGGGWDTEFTPKGALAQSLGQAPLGNIHFRGYYGGFVPSYSLNILQNHYKNQFANAQLNLQKATYQSVRLSIISQVAGAYFMLVGQKEQLQNQYQILHDFKKIRQLENIRYKAGTSDLSTLISVDQHISDQQAIIPSIKNSIAQVENSLQVLISHNPAPLVHIGKIHSLRMKGLVPAYIPSSVLKNRPDMMIAEEQLKLAALNVGIAKSNFFPNITLTGLLGGTSIELAHLLSISTGLWVANAAASAPILNGVTYEQIQAAKSGYLAAYFTYTQTVRSIFSDVDNNLTNQQQLKVIYQQRLNAWIISKRTYSLALSRYKAGSQDYREVANALLGVDQARLEVTLAKMQWLDSIVGLYQSLAGGYNVIEHS
jgi:NodT family efflux transporter outer membrane factor (OMF) lipoprotein